MTVLKKLCRWYPSKFSQATIDFTDDVSWNIRKSEEPQNSSAEITLINPKNRFVNNTVYPKYVNDDGEIFFQDGDIVKLYARQATDGMPIDTSAESADLLFVGEVLEVNVRLGEKESKITLKCADKSYTMLNRLWSFPFESSKNMTAPLIIQNVIRNTTDDTTSLIGYDDNGNLKERRKGVKGVFDVDARFESVEGFIEDTRPNQGIPDPFPTGKFPNDDPTKFPYKSLAKVMKPAYEWIQDLSQPEMTNTAAEIDSGSPPCDRAFVYYVDERNRFHWFYPTDTANLTFTEGSTSGNIIYSMNMTKAVFDIVNFVIFSAGEDLNNVGISWYHYDETSDSPRLKMAYKAYTDIATRAKENEIYIGNISLGTDGRTVTVLKSYPFTTSWGESVSNFSAYNTAFRNYCKLIIGKARAAAFTKRRNHARWKGTMELKGKKYNPTDLINLTSPSSGIKAVLVRIKEVQHNIQKDGWFTTLTIEEDEKKIGG